MHKILTENQKQDVIERYIAGESTGVLAKKYEVCNCHINTLLRKNNIKIRTANETKRFKYPINEQAFDTITEESAYWIGVLMADGCISSNGSSRRVVLALAERDRAHVEKLAKFLGCVNHKIIRVRRPKGGYNVMLAITSERLVEKLIGYGVTPNKLFTATPPEELITNRHFWRGVIDGDGCLTLRADKYPVISLTGSKPVCEAFCDYVKLLTKCWANIYPSKTVWAFSISSNFAVAAIKNLYENCTISLDHKQKLANEFIKWKENNDNNEFNLLTHDGKIQKVSKWAKESGLPYATIWNRLERGWPIEEALKNTNKKDRLLTFEGKTQNITRWAEDLDIPRNVLYNRLRNGWSVARVLSKGKNHKVRVASEKHRSNLFRPSI
jgi:hypothetical protein